MNQTLPSISYPREASYLKQERVRSLSPEFAVPGYLKDLPIVFDRIPKYTNKGFPHVPVERITDKHQSLSPQPLQHIGWVQPASFHFIFYAPEGKN